MAARSPTMTRLDRAVLLARPVVLRFLREPLTRRSRAELGYFLLNIPVTVMGLSYTVVSLLVGAALSITAIGVPLIGYAVRGARGLGGMRRRMARRFLDEHVTPPPPLDLLPGVLGRLSSRLRDKAGWRSILYQLVSVPMTVIGVYVVAVTWAWGLIMLTYPLQHLLGWNESTVVDAQGEVHHGFVFFNTVFDAWDRQIAVSLTGVALLLIAPWAVRALLLVDRLLIRGLLGPGGTEERIRNLERSRAYAIEDVAATLRRIERDLHDGAQARMVALAMNLTMLNETLGPNIDPDSKRLLAAARDHAKDALVELREVVGNIHPPALDGGLATALSTLAARSPIPVDLHTDVRDRPAAAIETIAYFSAAELVTNVTKHTKANQITINVLQMSDRLHVIVKDDGQGGAKPNGGTGLRGLTERVGTVDGHLAIQSPPGGPTVITVDLPMHT